MSTPAGRSKLQGVVPCAAAGTGLTVLLVAVFGSFAVAAGCRGGADGGGAGLPARDVTAATLPRCGVDGHEALRGVVVRHEGGYALQVGDRVVPVYDTSMTEAAAPRGPDLSARLGEERTLCGHHDGAALYEARPPEQAR